MGNTRSANEPTQEEGVFLFDGSPGFMIIAFFVLKVVEILSAMAHKSWPEKDKYPDFVKFLLFQQPAICCSTKG